MKEGRTRLCRHALKIALVKQAVRATGKTDASLVQAPTLSPPFAATLAIHHPGGALFYPFVAAATPHSEKLETGDGY